MVTRAFLLLAMCQLFCKTIATEEDDLVNVKIEGLEVQMGADGTNDHVTAQFSIKDKALSTIRKVKRLFPFQDLYP